MKSVAKSFVILMMALFLFSCENKEDKPFEPYGAEKINYDEIKNISKDGPVIESVHAENVPPFSNMQGTKERGPLRNDDKDLVVEPTADMDAEPDYGGIPIVIKEPVRDRESESETNESE